MQTGKWLSIRQIRNTNIALASLAALVMAAGCAKADVPLLIQQAAGFLNTGGYSLSSGSGRSALGSLKFYNAGGYYARPKNYGRVAMTAGIESINVSDHFLPFQGGNELNLLGPSLRLSTIMANGRFQPYITGSLFAGRLRSVGQNFDKTDFTPSMAVGANMPLTRSISLFANYRLSQKIHGVDINGIGFGIKLF